MKEFIEKLIEILKEKKNHYSDEAEKLNNFPQMQHCRRLQMRSYETSIKIVNHLADEYKDKYVSRAVLEQVMWERDVAIEQLKELGYGLGEEVGWIPCSERLPETYEYVLVWCNGRFIEGPCIGEECQWYGIGVLYGKVWTVYQCKDIKDIEVLKWRPLPPQPEGEPNVKP